MDDIRVGCVVAGVFIFGLVWILLSIDPSRQENPLLVEAKKVISECEDNLPRTQKCKWVITAVPK